MDTENNDQSNDIQQTPQESEPVSVPQEPMVESEQPGNQKQGKTPWILFAVIFLILALVLGAYFGYRNGIARRLEKEKITVSMGVSEFLEVDDLESCIKRADIALYKAKADGRNRVVSEKECEKEIDVMVKK